MSQKAALLINGQVLNIARFPDGALTPPWVPFVEGMQVGWGWDGSAATPPTDDPATEGVDEAVQLAQKAAAIAALPDTIKFLNAEERGIASSLFPEWRAGIPVVVDEVYRFEGGLYRVIQAHTTQADWTPPTVLALFEAL